MAGRGLRKVSVASLATIGKRTCGWRWTRDHPSYDNGYSDRVEFLYDDRRKGVGGVSEGKSGGVYTLGRRKETIPPESLIDGAKKCNYRKTNSGMVSWRVDTT